MGKSSRGITAGEKRIEYSGYTVVTRLGLPCRILVYGKRQDDIEPILDRIVSKYPRAILQFGRWYVSRKRKEQRCMVRILAKADKNGMLVLPSGVIMRVDKTGIDPTLYPPKAVCEYDRIDVVILYDGTELR